MVSKIQEVVPGLFGLGWLRRPARRPIAVLWEQKFVQRLQTNGDELGSLGGLQLLQVPHQLAVRERVELAHPATERDELAHQREHLIETRRSPLVEDHLVSHIVRQPIPEDGDGPGLNLARHLPLGEGLRNTDGPEVEASGKPCRSPDERGRLLRALGARIELGSAPSGADVELALGEFPSVSDQAVFATGEDLVDRRVALARELVQEVRPSRKVPLADQYRKYGLATLVGVAVKRKLDLLPTTAFVLHRNRTMRSGETRVCVGMEVSCGRNKWWRRRRRAVSTAGGLTIAGPRTSRHTHRLQPTLALDV